LPRRYFLSDTQTPRSFTYSGRTGTGGWLHDWLATQTEPKPLSEEELENFRKLLEKFTESVSKKNSDEKEDKKKE